MTTRTVVAGVLAPDRAIDVDSFADITTATVTDVSVGDGIVTVTFDGALTADQTTAALRRITMPQSVAAALDALESRVAALETRSP